MTPPIVRGLKYGLKGELEQTCDVNSNKTPVWSWACKVAKLFVGLRDEECRGKIPAWNFYKKKKMGGGQKQDTMLHLSAIMYICNM